MYDIIVIGGGPAGLSAAINGRQKGRSVAVVSNDSSQSGLYKALEVWNYPGFPKITGRALIKKLADHAVAAGAELITGRVSVVMPMGTEFSIGYGTEILSAKSLIIATGVAQTSLFPGEAEYLGRGVSYCTTCDGMLFRGKRVCAVCHAPEAEEEAAYLESIGCEVIRVKTKDIVIKGGDYITSITAAGEEIGCEGVFIMRHAVAPHLLVSGLEMDGRHIRTDLDCQTNISGVFAAGDCTGTPYQIAKAVGQGLVAALAASDFVIKDKFFA